MSRRYFSILLAFFFALLLCTMAGCSEGATEQTSSSPLRSTQTVDHPRHTPVNATLIPVPETSYPSLETPTTPSITAPYHLIDPSDFSIDFTLDTPVPPGRYIITVEESYARKTEIKFKVINFAGDVVSTLDVEIIDEDISYPHYSVTQIHAESKQLLIGVVDNGHTIELYIFDLLTTSISAISLECETMAGTAVNALGRKYLAFRCWDETNTWHFVHTADPSESYSFTVPIAADPFEYIPIWVSADEILFNGTYEKAFCLGSIPDWDPLCENIPYWPSRLTTDVGLLELREGDYYRPTAIGALSIDCLQSGSQDCDPILIENPFNDPQAGVINPLSSSWVPGTSSILYLMMIDYDQNTNAADETEIWLAKYPEGTIVKLDVLEGEFILSELGFPDTPAIWLDNGTEVILNKLNDLVVYNIETGEQRSIGYHGKVLGTIEIK